MQDTRISKQTPDIKNTFDSIITVHQNNAPINLDHNNLTYPKTHNLLHTYDYKVPDTLNLARISSWGI